MCNDLVSSPEVNPDFLTNFPWNCDFSSKDFCRFNQEPAELKWEHKEGQSQRAGTGPPESGIGQKGTYLLFDGSVESANLVSRLRSPTFPDFSVDGNPYYYCLRMSINMYGPVLGSLVIRDVTERPVFGLSGGNFTLPPFKIHLYFTKC